MTEKFNPEDNKKYWNEFAQKIKDDPHGASGSTHLVDIENQFIESILQKLKPQSLLDIGCGNGQRTLLFAKNVSDTVLGIDYSPEMIKIADNTLLSKNSEIKNKISFKNSDVNSLPEKNYDVIVSCRCIINQPSRQEQKNLIFSLSKCLKSGGSLILAEISKEGMKNLNLIREKYGLSLMNDRWHNLHIDEKFVFESLEELFEIKEIQRAGTFYFISRVLYPSMIYPKDPEQEHQLNDVALKSELLMHNEFDQNNNSLEKFGAHLLMHLIKK